VIVLTNVHARPLRALSLSWTRGVFAVIGAPLDGTSALLSVIAGATSPKRGTATIDGRAADRMRTSVAHVPLEAPLPEALRVDEVCDLAIELRGDPKKTAAERLALLGLEALAKRKVKTLSPGEARAVAIAIAATSAAKVIAIEEPLAWLEPTAPSRVVEVLRARAASGTPIVVTTSSVRDATRIADELAVLTQGVLTPLPPALAHVGPAGARLRVIVPSPSEGAPAPAALVGALAAEAAIASVETHVFATPTPDAKPASAIVVSGKELVALASAVNRAIAQTGVVVEAIESAVLPLDAIRAALVAPRGPALPSLPPAAPPASLPPPGSVPPQGSAPPPAPGGAA